MSTLDSSELGEVRGGDDFPASCPEGENAENTASSNMAAADKASMSFQSRHSSLGSVTSFDSESKPMEIERINELRRQHTDEIHRRKSHVKKQSSFGIFSKILDTQHSVSDYAHTSHTRHNSVSIDACEHHAAGNKSAAVENLPAFDPPLLAGLGRNDSPDPQLATEESNKSGTSDSHSCSFTNITDERKKLVDQRMLMPSASRQQSMRYRALAQVGVKRQSATKQGRSFSPSLNSDSSSFLDSAIASSALASSRVRRMSTTLPGSVAPLEDLSFTKRPFASFMPNAFIEALDVIEHEKSRKRNRLLSYKLRVALGELPEGLEDGAKSWSTFWELMKRATSIKKKYQLLANYCKFITEHSKFVAFITFFILLAGINVGAQTDERIIGNESLKSISRILDESILSVFTMEVALKVIGEGTSPWVYFKDNWNKFDFMVVVGSYAPGAGSLLAILRLLRLLRVLKLVKSLPQLEVIVNALLMGMSSIAYIGMILFLCFYVFAILGMILFRDNDPFHFGNLHISMFTLFRCSTLDDWSEIMYVNMFGCDRYLGVYEDFPELCTRPKGDGVVAAFYFITFIIVGAQVLLTLFIGVVTTSMEQAKDIQAKEQTMSKRLGTLQRSLKLSDVQMKFFQEVFTSLDMDGGGTIEIEEIELSFSTINDLFLGTNIQDELARADTSGEGIDVITFILIMSSVPAFRYKRLLRRNIQRWIAQKRQGKKMFREKKPTKLRKSVPTTEELHKRFDALLVKHNIPVYSTLDRRRSGSWVAEDDHEMNTLMEVAQAVRRDMQTKGDHWIEKIVSTSPHASKMPSMSSSHSSSFRDRSSPRTKPVFKRPWSFHEGDIPSSQPINPIAPSDDVSNSQLPQDSSPKDTTCKQVECSPTSPSTSSLGAADAPDTLVTAQIPSAIMSENPVSIKIQPREVISLADYHPVGSSPHPRKLPPLATPTQSLKREVSFSNPHTKQDNKQTPISPLRDDVSVRSTLNSDVKE